MNEVTLCKTLFLAEHLGGAFYDRFSAHVDHTDVAGVFHEFAGDEHLHAKWYADWLGARGHSVPNPSVPDALILPGARIFLAPQSLDRKLRTFSWTEAAAARHLSAIAQKLQDPELRSIVEKTIPAELEHAGWYALEGRKMLRPSDQH
jgi:rubrerythrin